MEGKLAFKTDVILERGSEKSIIKWLPAASWDGNRKPLTLPAWDSIQVGNVIWFFSSFGSGKKKHFWFELSFPRYWGLEHPMTQDTLEGNKILKFFIAWCFSPTTLNPLLGTREDYLMLRSLTGKLMRARSWLASPARLPLTVLGLGLKKGGDFPHKNYLCSAHVSATFGVWVGIYKFRWYFKCHLIKFYFHFYKDEENLEPPLLVK